ncbi:MAG TPA: hypothetical protein VFD01_00755 [Candidatus Dormibacteraeota bacterium]|nr:hypothetical protein [Candidatus Dormibacteraeota bacterium]
MVAPGLYRRYEPEAQRLGGFQLPARLHVWETGRGEIDFVYGPRAELDVVEVRWRRVVSAPGARSLHRTLPSHPAVVVTQDDLHLDHRSELVPAHLFMWLVG